MFLLGSRGRLLDGLLPRPVGKYGAKCCSWFSTMFLQVTEGWRGQESSGGSGMNLQLDTTVLPPPSAEKSSLLANFTSSKWRPPPTSSSLVELGCLDCQLKAFCYRPEVGNARAEKLTPKALSFWKLIFRSTFGTLTTADESVSSPTLTSPRAAPSCRLSS